MASGMSSQLLAKVVNAETREKIVMLDQKLKIMHAEVEAKLASMALHHEDDLEPYKGRESLLNVQQEINSALNSISALVNLAIISGQEQNVLSEIDEFTSCVFSTF